jgi:hypothetical protein
MTDEQPILIDGVWRPEEWRGKYLLVRHILQSTGIAKREIYSENPYSAFAVIFEEESTASALADKLNSELVAAMLPPEKKEDENDLSDQAD